MVSALKDCAPIAISLLALVVSGLSLRISGLNYWRAVRAEDPTAIAWLRALPEPNWYEAVIEIENRRTHSIRWNTVSFIAPKNARGMHKRKGYVERADVNAPDVYMAPLPIDQATTTVECSAILKKAGTPTPTSQRGIKLGIGDSHSLRFLVFVRPSKWSKALLIRVRLSSIEEVERDIVIDIKRTLPQAVKTAAA